MEKADRLYRRYARAMLHAAVCKTDDYQLAEDAVQHAFIKVLRIGDRIDEQDTKRTGALLKLMAQHAVVELYASKVKSLGELFLDALQGSEAASSDPEGERDTVSALARALRWLPEKYYQPILLRYGYELKPSEIAQVLGINRNLLNVRLYRGKQKIIAYIRKKGRLLPE